jgi:ketosteroid isomerase-like protein
MTTEQIIGAQIEHWAQSVASGNREGILAHHAKDHLMFDFPDTVRGIDAYDKTWQFFDDSRRGPVSFAPRDIKVTASDSVAFASCIIHCDGTTAGSFDLRLTVCLEKRGDEWIVIHEHHSVPTTNETLIGPDAKQRKHAA